MLEELENIHSKQEDYIMHVFNNVGKLIEKIEDGCQFTERILERGNTTEMLLMKRFISAQLLSLISNTPKPDVRLKILLYVKY
jgi:hypothetical protein